MIQKTALVGLHEAPPRKMFIEMFTRRGYRTTLADNVNEMLNQMGVDSQQGAMPTNNFGLYFMDLNLGSPGGESYEPATLVYKYVKPYIERGEAKFLAVSWLPEIVEAAKNAGIPCADKTDMGAFKEFIGPLNV